MPRIPGAQPPARSLVAVALAGLLGTGCAAPPLVLMVRLDADTRSAPAQTGPPPDYEAGVRAIAVLLTQELGLPLPREFTVFVYPSRRAYAEGLADAGAMPLDRAAAIARYSAGLGQARRLLINDAALRAVPPGVWLGVLAHELTHVAQYELSGGRRGRSEQWLREGMADWVACWVAERLGVGAFRDARARAERAVARGLRTRGEAPLDLAELGRPRAWEARHLRTGGDRLTYRLAFLLADELIRRRGFDRLLAYFRAFADSNDRFGNFHRAFGLTLGEFEAEALGRLRAELSPAGVAD